MISAEIVRKDLYNKYIDDTEDKIGIIRMNAYRYGDIESVKELLYWVENKRDSVYTKEEFKRILVRKYL